MIPHPSANSHQRKLNPSLHRASMLCGRRELDGGQLRRLLGRSRRLRLLGALHWVALLGHWPRLRLLGRLRWLTLLSPRCRSRLRL
jgi:hypothetical protein